MRVLLFIIGLCLFVSPAWAGGKERVKNQTIKASATSSGDVSIRYDDRYQAPSFGMAYCTQVASGGFSHFGLGIGNQSKMCELAMYVEMLNQSGLAWTKSEDKLGYTDKYPTREVRKAVEEAEDIAFARTGWFYDQLRKTPFIGGMF